MELIGLAAILDDKAFQSGLKRYQDGISQMETLTDRGASTMTKIWAVGSGVVIAGAAGIAAGMAGILAVSKQGLDSINAWGNQLDALGDVLGTSGEQSATWAVAMKQVGLSVEEGAGGINIFLRNLDNLKNVGSGAALVTAKNAEAIQNLRERLDDANVRLDRAKMKLAAAAKPTQEMQWAVDDAQKAVNRLNAELGAATKMVPAATEKMTPFQEALKTLGVRAFDAKGKLRTFDDLMPEIMRAFQKMPDGVKKSALAMDLFGRSGTKFLDFLNQGDAGLEKAIRLGKMYGLTMSSEMVQATQEFQYALEVSKLGLQGFWVQIGAKVLPVAKKFVDFFNEKLLPPLVKFAEQVAPFLGEVLDNLYNIFSDFFLLLSGEDKLPQFARNVGDLASKFGLSGEQVTKFILDVGAFLDKAVPAVQSFLGWLGKLADTIMRGDWGSVWTQISQGVAQAWNFIQPILAEWGNKFWTWLTGPGGALEQAAAKVGEFAKGVGKFLQDNGPAAWAQLQAWAGEFWTWLTDPKEGALTKAGGVLSEFAGKVRGVLDEYGPRAWGLVELWGGAFWDWLVGKGGAVEQISAKMVKWTEAFRVWATSEQKNKDLLAAGAAIANAILGGVNIQLGDTKSAEGALRTFLIALGRAALNIDAALRAIGHDLANYILAGFWENMLKGIDFIKFQLGIPGGSMTAQTPPGGTPLSYASQQAIMLRVSIDGTEIKHATVEKAYVDINSIFTDAMNLMAQP